MEIILNSVDAECNNFGKTYFTFGFGRNRFSSWNYFGKTESNGHLKYNHVVGEERRSHFPVTLFRSTVVTVAHAYIMQFLSIEYAHILQINLKN